MADKPNTSASPIQLTVATAEVKKEKPEGILFYILPPLVVAAVFAYCAIVKPDIEPAKPVVSDPTQSAELEGVDIEDLEEVIAAQDKASAEASGQVSEAAAAADDATADNDTATDSTDAEEPTDEDNTVEPEDTDNTTETDESEETSDDAPAEDEPTNEE